MAIAGARIDPIPIAPGFRLDRADAAHFQPHLGDDFSVLPTDGSARVRVRLAKVLEKPPTRDVSRFTLIFHGRSSQPLADGIHAFRHPALGSFSIFISPIGADAGERRAYQACFSRHVG
jgi:hypothetical protein